MQRYLFAIALVGILASTSHATVTSETRTKDTMCAGGTAYTYDFYVLSTDDLVVATYATACGTGTATNVAFTATRTASGGTVTTSAACAAPKCLRISRVVDLTQEVAFRTQGSYTPGSHENQFDKTMMAIQQIQDGVVQSEETATAITNHISSSDDHNLYAYLPGRAGGQTWYGGTAAGDDLTIASTTTFPWGDVNIQGTIFNKDGAISTFDDLTANFDLYCMDEAFLPTIYGGISSGDDITIDSTKHATKGTITIGGSTTMVIDDVNNLIGIGGAVDAAGIVSGEGLQCLGDVLVDGTIYGGNAAGDNLSLASSSNETKGKITFGTSVYNEVNNRLGIGTAAPTVPLDVVGAGHFSTDVVLDGDLTVGDDATITGIITANTVVAPYLFGDTAAAGWLFIGSTTNAAPTSGTILFGLGANKLAIDDLNGRIGIGDTTPDYSLHNQGDTKLAGNVGVGTAPGAYAFMLNGDAVLDGILYMNEFGGAEYNIYDSPAKTGAVCLGDDVCVDIADNHLSITTASDPVLAACGVVPTIVGGDNAGKITIGSGVTTSCSMTFNVAFNAAPACVVTGDNAAVGYAASTTTTVLTITSSADMSTDVISYICIGL